MSGMVRGMTFAACSPRARPKTRLRVMFLMLLPSKTCIDSPQLSHQPLGGMNQQGQHLMHPITTSWSLRRAPTRQQQQRRS